MKTALPRFRFFRFLPIWRGMWRGRLGSLIFVLGLGTGLAAQKVEPKPKAQPKARPVAEEIEFDFAAPDTSKFEELKIEKSFVIEAKVERPQVQFPLLKEPPPEKQITFEASFREELLKAPRENTFKLK
jgi:hypothetical protein